MLIKSTGKTCHLAREVIRRDHRVPCLKSSCVELLSLLDLLDRVTALRWVENDPATQLCEGSACELRKHEDCNQYFALHYILLLVL